MPFLWHTEALETRDATANDIIYRYTYYKYACWRNSEHFSECAYILSCSYVWRGCVWVKETLLGVTAARLSGESPRRAPKWNSERQKHAILVHSVLNARQGRGMFSTVYFNGPRNGVIFKLFLDVSRLLRITPEFLIAGWLFLANEQSNHPSVWSRILLDKLTLVLLVKKLPFIGPENTLSLPWSYRPITGPWLDPNPISFHHCHRLGGGKAGDSALRHPRNLICFYCMNKMLVCYCHSQLYCICWRKTDAYKRAPGNERPISWISVIWSYERTLLLYERKIGCVGGGMWDYNPVFVSFWTSSMIFTKFGVNIMPLESTRTCTSNIVDARTYEVRVVQETVSSLKS